MLMKFFIKAMCLLSLVKNKAYIEYEKYKCLNVRLPTRKTLFNMIVEHKSITAQSVRDQLDNIEYVNLSVDSWSDATIRCFNGYICFCLLRS